jgi:hypothetical protein
VNNALKYVKILEGTGITREQAETHIQIISEILEGDLVTKQDIKNLDIKFETIEHKILQSEYRMTIKLGSIVTLAIAAATAVIKLF